MTRSLLFSLMMLFTICGVAQADLVMPGAAKIHDLPGNNFLVAYGENDQVRIMELAGDGSIVWQDSVDMQGGADFFIADGIYQFGNADDYVFICERDLANLTSFNDSTVYQFVRFSSAAQQVSNFKIDTIYSHNIEPMEYRDTAIMIFNILHDTILFVPYSAETLILDTNLVLSSYSPVDSIGVSYYDNTFFETDDTLHLLESFDGSSVSNTRYSIPPSEIDYSWYLLPSGPTFNSVAYFDRIGVDTILLVSESSWTGTPYTEWLFALLDEQLNPLLEKEGPSEYVYSTTWNEDFYYDIFTMSVVEYDNLIYVLAHLQDDVGETETIFVYDLNFDLVCEIPVVFAELHYDKLHVINNTVYFSRDYGSARHYSEIDVCSFTSGLPVPENPGAFSIYPNPATTQFELTTGYDNVSVKLFDNTGRCVLITEVDSSPTIISIEHLPAGIYVLNATTDVFEATVKVVKL